MNKSAVTIGKFEGIHRGHQLLIDEITKVAESKKYDAVFLKIRMPGQCLMTEDEEKAFLNDKYPELKDIVYYDFSPEFAGMTPQSFVEDILVKRFNVGFVAVGNDFRFGCKRAGDVELLKQLGETYGFEVKVFDKLSIDGEMVSSTNIKSHIQKSEMEEALKLLGHPYMLSGIVEGGKKLGRTLGYPTINLKYDEDKMLPGYGVYASDIIIDEKRFKGITNIGIRPSVDDGNKPTVETFIYDFSDDIYGVKTEVIPTRFIRSERRFQSLDDLTNQIELDILDADRNQ